MFRSIQSSLQIWHAILLLTILIAFDIAVYATISRTRNGQINAELSLSAQTLAAGIKPPPPRDRGFPRERGREGGERPEHGGPLDRKQPDRPDSDRSPSERSPRGPRPDEQDENRPGDMDRSPGGRMEPREDPGIQLPAEWLATRSDPLTRYYRIWHFNDLLASSDDSFEVPPPELQQQRRPWPEPKPPTIRERGSLREAYVYGDFDTLVLVGQSIAAEKTQLARLAAMLSLISAIVWLVGLVVGWLISRRTMLPIRAMTTVAQNISGSNLSERIDAGATKAELRALADVLNETFSRLEAAFQQQSRFIADASHELRTPLSVIHTHTQLALTRDRAVPEYRKTLETCLRASSRMTELVNALLLLARTDAGRVALNTSRVNLQDIVVDAIELVTSLAQERNITIESDLQPLIVTVDIACMNQLVTNLLTNAIRYNRPNGRVHVSLNQDGHDFVLTVNDTGVGIPENCQPHLFERFYRADESRNRADGGTGLGLAICRSIVDAHQGSISLISKPDEGTSLVVRIPTHSKPLAPESTHSPVG